EAIDAYFAAVQANAEYTEAYFAMGTAQKKLNKNAEALAAFDRTVQLNPKMPEAHYMKGSTLRALNRLKDAAEAYQAALAVSPTYALAHYWLGETHKELGQYDAAIAAYTAAIKYDVRKYAKAYCKIGDILELKGDLQGALEQYGKMPAYDRQWHTYAQDKIKYINSVLKKQSS
ncbi:tetratricopeptide repeat protein, partial [Candidatus Fermentibacteria bacterium]|nr:tetratricopeptide repeat protein [Candidatus Fermentibacteria bacterium]